MPVPYLRLVPSAITFNSTGGTATVNVELNINWSLKISGETAIVTGITIDNFEWTSNFPSSAGTYLTKDYSTFNVTAHYDNGATKDVTNEAEITGQVTLEENTSANSRIVQAPLNAKYVVLTISVTKKGFQSVRHHLLRYTSKMKVSIRLAVILLVWAHQIQSLFKQARP